VPPGKYNWTCASFGPLESTTQTANGSVQPFLQSSRQKVPILYPRLTHNALGPCMPTTQTKRHLDQFSRDSVLILYNGSPVFPSKLPFSMGIWNPCNTWFIGPTRVLNPNGKSIVSAVFAGLTSVADWQSNRHTNIPHYTVGNNCLIGRMYIHSTGVRCNVGCGKATLSFHVHMNNFATIKSLSEHLKHLVNYFI